MDPCHGCPLQPEPQILGAGDKSGLVVVGEAPGATEVRLGKPFVGRAGQLLRASWTEADLDDTPIWYTNACLCRPPKNRTPIPAELHFCHQRLVDELSIVEPKVILALGGPAWTTLGHHGVRKIQAVGKARGFVYPANPPQLFAPTVVTYHPAGILRRPDFWRDYLQDLQLVRAVLDHRVPKPPKPRRIICESIDEVQHELKVLAQASVITCDVETTFLERHRRRLLAIGLTGDGIRVVIIPVELARQIKVKRLLRKFIATSTAEWTYQNAPFDVAVLREFGFDPPIGFDTMLAAYAVDERRGHHGLKYLARTRLQAEDYDIKQDPTVDNTKSWARISRRLLYEYHAKDVTYTHAIRACLKQEMKADNVLEVFEQVLMPALPVIISMQYHGMLTDAPYLEDLGQRYRRRTMALRTRVAQLVASRTGVTNFNVASPVQVSRLLFTKLGVPSGRHGTSTRAVFLERHLEQSKLTGPTREVIQAVLSYRKATTMESHVEGLLGYRDKDDRVRAQWHLTGTRTGRLSASNPPMMALPGPGQAGIEVRLGLIAAPGWVLLEADRKQSELRVLAYLSGDSVLIESLSDGRDPHTETAVGAFGIPREDVTVKDRFRAKMINFGIPYGRLAKSTALLLDITVKAAQELLDAHAERYHVLHSWMAEQKERVLSEGETITPFGRKRRFPLITRDNSYDIEKQAINTPAQSTSSDLTLLADIDVFNHVDPERARPVHFSHDGFTYEVREEYVDTIIPVVRQAMTRNYLETSFDWPVDIVMGHRWGNLTKIK